MTDKIVVLSTCDSSEQAAALARKLVESRLAACVNVVPNVRSIYRWKGEVEDAMEWQLVIKSRRDLFEKVREALASVHSYEVPEVIAFPIVDGSPGYLDWMDRELGEPNPAA